jgi:hypothetical protein
MKLLSKFFVCVQLILIASSFSYADSTSGIVVYYSSQNKFQTLLAVAINKHINDTFSNLPVRFNTDNDLSVIHENDLIISIGNQDKIDANLGALTNEIIYINDTVKQSTGTRLNKSYISTEIEQPPCRYLNLIRAIDKQWRNVGYLKSSADDNRLTELKKCAKDMGLVISDVIVENDDDLPEALDRLLHDCDALLALPNNRIYNRHSVKNILLSSYRQRIPVIGFSKSFVGAGALAAAYSTPDQIAQQLISIITNLLKPDRTPVGDNVYPEDFSVSTNKQVAKSLDLQIPDDDSIKFSMQLLEGKK